MRDHARASARAQEVRIFQGDEVATWIFNHPVRFIDFVVTGYPDGRLTTRRFEKTV